MGKIIKGYKGFDQNLKCRDMQYEVGGEYELEGEVECCSNGLHFCENPFDVFAYYPPSDSRYCEVEGSGNIDRHNDDSKVACSKLKIEKEIGIMGLVEAGRDLIFEKVDWKNATVTNSDGWSVATDIRYRSAVKNTGHHSAAMNTGYQSVAINTGYHSAATNTGGQSAATSMGVHSVAINTGNQSVAINTGYRSVATNTGGRSAATNTGYESAATNTGNQSVAINTGYDSVATNTGYESVAINTGDRSAAANTGEQSAAINTGIQSVATNTGEWSSAIVEGAEAVAVAIGYKGKAKGALGCWLVLAEWDGEEHIIDVQCRKVDGESIKPDTFYRLCNGEFIEVSS